MKKTIFIYSYSKCNSCRKALKWLQENQLGYELLDIIDTPPSKNNLLQAVKQYGGCKKLFNTSGISYRKIGAKVIKAMSDEESIEALLNDPKLIKRPFLVTENNYFLIGFKESEWAHVLKI